MKKEFIVGARKLLGTIEELILNLGKPLCEDDTLKLLFRKFNSLKGGANASGFIIYSKMIEEMSKIIIRLNAEEIKVDKKVVEDLAFGIQIILEMNNTYLHDLDSKNDFSDKITAFKDRFK